MLRRGPSIRPVRPALLLAVSAALLAGCAEMHRGAEAVGRIGGPPAPAAEADAAVPGPAVKVVRLPGAARPAAGQVIAAEPPPPAVLASAVPSPRQIFDFHPAGSRPDAWRQPFVIDTSDGPLAADVRRSSAELRAFLADQKAGRDKAGVAADRRRCGEDAAATGKSGCAAAPTRAAATRAEGAAPQ